MELEQEADGTGKQPRTERGRRTMRKLLDAAALEFGERGFHDASISGITRRAGVALGTFYTYFDSKEALFRELVSDMSALVMQAARTAIADSTDPYEVEQRALAGFLSFAGDHKEIYRIIDEAEFVDPASYRAHYETIAARIASRLARGSAAGAMRGELGEVEAWAIMGMNVFLGLRYAIWREAGDPSLDAVADTANRMLREGIKG